MTQIKKTKGTEYIRMTWLAANSKLSYMYLYQNQHILKAYFGLRRLEGRLYVEKDLAEEFVNKTAGLIPFVDVKGLPRNINARSSALEDSGYQVIMGFPFVTNVCYAKKRFAKRRE